MVLLVKCISKYTEHPVFDIGSIMWNIALREYTLNYCPLRKGNTENQLFQYYTTLNGKQYRNNALLFLKTSRGRPNW